MAEIKILIAFDIKTTAFPLELLKKKLAFENMYCDVFFSTQDINALLRRRTYSLLLLCFTMDNGVDELISIRTHSFIPIIVFSHTGDYHDLILYLRAGADECIEHGYENMDIVTNKIRSLIRRAFDYNERKRVNVVIENRDMVIHHDTRSVFVGGEKILFTPTEYKIIFYLAQNAGRILSREQIYENIWHETYDAENDPLDTHMYNIRTKIGSEKNATPYITTEWGMGFRFG